MSNVTGSIGLCVLLAFDGGHFVVAYTLGASGGLSLSIIINRKIYILKSLTGKSEVIEALSLVLPFRRCVVHTVLKLSWWINLYDSSAVNDEIMIII